LGEGPKRQRAGGGKAGEDKVPTPGEYGGVRGGVVGGKGASPALRREEGGWAAGGA